MSEEKITGRLEEELICEDPEESQCKECSYNNLDAYDLCDKFGIKPSDYKWNREKCPERIEK